MNPGVISFPKHPGLGKQNTSAATDFPQDYIGAVVELPVDSPVIQTDSNRLYIKTGSMIENPSAYGLDVRLLGKLGLSTLGNAGRTADVTSSGNWDVAYGSGMYVAIPLNTVCSKVLYSSDGFNWTATPLNNNAVVTLQCVEFAAGYFVINGAVYNSAGNTSTVEPCIFRSSNGVNWTQTIALPTGQTFSNEIVFGVGKYLTVSTSGTVVTSADGFNWAVSATLLHPKTGVALSIIGVHFTNSKFIALTNASDSAFAATSTDGITWQMETSDLTASHSGDFLVAYGNGVYVAFLRQVYSPYFFTSTDGMAWTKRTFSEPAILAATYPPNPTTILFANNQFVVDIGTRTIITSTTGLSWNVITTAVGSPRFGAIIYNGTNTYVGSAGGGTNLYVSTDLVTWSAKTIPGNNSGRTLDPNALSYGGGKFVQLGYNTNDSSAAAYYSTDGQSWTASTNFQYRYWTALIYTGTAFVGTGYDPNGTSGVSCVVRSTDGVTWTTKNIATTYAIPRRIVQTGNAQSGYVLIAYCSGNFNSSDGSANTQTAVSTDDGQSWTANSTTLHAAGSQANAAYATMANGKTIVFSSNSSWTSITSDFATFQLKGRASSAISYNCCANNGNVTCVPFYANETHAGVGGNNIGVANSSDGLVWNYKNQTFSNTVASTLVYGSKFVLIQCDGVNSKTFNSGDNGLTWSQAGNYPTSDDFISGNVKKAGNPSGMIVLTGNNGQVRYASNDGSVWSSSNVSNWYSNTLRVVWSVDKFIVFQGYNPLNTIAGFTSSNGASWATIPGNAAAVGNIFGHVPYHASACNNKVFVVVPTTTSGAIFQSADGLVYSGALPQLASAAEKNMRSVNGKLVAFQRTSVSSRFSNIISVSADGGATWTLRALSNNYDRGIAGLTYCPELASYFAVSSFSNDTALFKSPDLAIWNQSNTLQTLNGPYTGIVAIGVSLYVSAVNYDTGTYYVSTNAGFSWINAGGNPNAKPAINLYTINGKLISTSSTEYYVGTPNPATPSTVTWVATGSVNSGKVVNSALVKIGSQFVTSSSSATATTTNDPSGLLIDMASIASCCISNGTVSMLCATTAATNFLYRSADGGITWASVTLPNSQARSIIANDGGSNWVVMSDNTSAACRSADNGATWQTTSAPTATPLASATNGAGTMAVCSASAMYTSTDGGISWQNTQNGTFSALTFGSNGFIVCGPTNGYIADDGITWNSIPNMTLGLTSIAAGNGIYLGCNGTNLYTSNDGYTWTVRTPTIPITALGAVAMTYGDGLFVIVSHTTGQMLESADGINWTARNTTDSGAAKKVIFFDKLSKNFYVIHSNGGGYYKVRRFYGSRSAVTPSRPGMNTFVRLK